MSENTFSYKDTLFGRLVQINESVPDGFIRMNRQTWEQIKPISHRNAVPVKVVKVQNESPRT